MANFFPLQPVSCCSSDSTDDDFALVPQIEFLQQQQQPQQRHHLNQTATVESLLAQSPLTSTPPFYLGEVKVPQQQQQHEQENSPEHLLANTSSYLATPSTHPQTTTTVFSAHHAITTARQQQSIYVTEPSDFVTLPDGSLIPLNHHHPYDEEGSGHEFLTEPESECNLETMPNDVDNNGTSVTLTKAKLSTRQNPYMIRPPKVTSQVTDLECVTASNRSYLDGILYDIVTSPRVRQVMVNDKRHNHPTYDEGEMIRMLLLLQNGEQRIITFTLPHEDCSIHDILEQLHIKFTAETPVNVAELRAHRINYMVTVGDADVIYHYHLQSDSKSYSLVNQLETTPPSPATPSTANNNNNNSSSNDKEEEPIPRYLSDKLAVCPHCGYVSEDFNFCSRCRRKLPINVRTIPKTPSFNSITPWGDSGGDRITNNNNNSGNNKKSTATPPLILNKTLGLSKLNLFQKKFHHSNNNNNNNNNSSSNNNNNSSSNGIVVRTTTDVETVIVSSDDDDDNSMTVDNANGKCQNGNVQHGHHLQVTTNSEVNAQFADSITKSTASYIAKEITSNDLKQLSASHSTAGHFAALKVQHVKCQTSLQCRTVRVGSYRFASPEDVRIDVDAIYIQVPLIGERCTIKTLTIKNTDIVRILCCFSKAMPVLFFYLMPQIAPDIRHTLEMTVDSDFYFDPLSETEESHRRLTLLPEMLTEANRIAFQTIYPKSIVEELTYKEANDLLVRICPKELARSVLDTSLSGGVGGVQHLVTYPPEGRGSFAINTEDYMCLGEEQFLNDVIIDFYLLYVFNNLPTAMQKRVHIFSNFFYKRLTTKEQKKTSTTSNSTSSSSVIKVATADALLTAAEKRHTRVKTWTKNVNIFDKDFIIVPINENCHWFLAIICFPGMNGPQTLDGADIGPQQEQKLGGGRTNKKPHIDRVTIDDGEGSDKDEAEGDDSELDDDDDDDDDQTTDNDQSVEEETKKIQHQQQYRPPIKQPCILIFDSLAGASRSRVVATLRDYLTFEYKSKLSMSKVFTKDVIKGACPKVPQQNNFTDCGLYVLQYVEEFFRKPIRDYRIPIGELRTWFDDDVVAKKRESIALLIKSLMEQYGKDTSLLPDIQFATTSSGAGNSDSCGGANTSISQNASAPDEEEAEEEDDDDDDDDDYDNDEEMRTSVMTSDEDDDVVEDDTGMTADSGEKGKRMTHKVVLPSTSSGSTDTTSNSDAIFRFLTRKRQNLNRRKNIKSNIPPPPPLLPQTVEQIEQQTQVKKRKIDLHST